jgi:hypothetical protein
MMLLTPIVLPIILSESYIVFESCDEEVTVRDWIKHREACGMSDRISVWSKLSALKEETTGVGVFFDSLLGLSDNTRFDFLHVNLLTQFDSFKPLNIFATNKNVSLVMSVDTTFVSDQISHWLECFSIGSHDNDLLFLMKRTRNSWQLSQRRHKHWLLRIFPCQLLKPHHEPTISRNATDTFLLIQVFNGLNKCFFDLWRHFPFLTHRKCETWYYFIMDVISEREIGVDVTSGWWVIIV